MAAAKAFLQPLTPAPYRSRNFREEDIPHSSLTVFVSPWQLSYAIIREDRHLLFVQAIEIPPPQREYYAEFCMKIIVGHSMFGKTYQSVSFRFYSHPYYWIPENYFNEAQLVHVASALHVENPYREIPRLAPDQNPLILAKFPAEVFNLLKLRLPFVSANHTYVHLLPHFSSQCSQEPSLFFYFFADSADLILIHEKNLKFCNHFSFNSIEELESHVQSLLNFCGIKKQETAFYVAGEIPERSALLKALTPALGAISFTSRVNDILFESDYPFPNHYFQNLFC